MNRNQLAALVLVLLLVGVPSALAGKVIPDVTGTDWTGAGKGKVAVKGQGADKGPAEFYLEFGPQGELADNEFLLQVGDESGTLEFPGTWTKDEKGRPVLAPDLDAVQDTLFEIIEDMIGTLPGTTVDMELQKWKLKAKPKTSKKKGDSMKVQASFKTFVTLTLLGQTESGKVTISFKGKGAPVVK
jgi:hypothetical protein